LNDAAASPNPGVNVVTIAQASVGKVLQNLYKSDTEWLASVTITQEVIDPWILAFDVATRVNSATSKPENQYGSPGPVIRPTARGVIICSNSFS
jgi:hypothetical protein